MDVHPPENGINRYWFIPISKNAVSVPVSPTSIAARRKDTQRPQTCLNLEAIARWGNHFMLRPENPAVVGKKCPNAPERPKWNDTWDWQNGSQVWEAPFWVVFQGPPHHPVETSKYTDWRPLVGTDLFVVASILATLGQTNLHLKLLYRCCPPKSDFDSMPSSLNCCHCFVGLSQITKYHQTKLAKFTLFWCGSAKINRGEFVFDILLYPDEHPGSPSIAQSAAANSDDGAFFGWGWEPMFGRLSHQNGEC